MTVSARDVETGLAQRLAAVWPLLVGNGIERPDSANVGDILEVVSNAVWKQPTSDRVWLLCAAVTGALPTTEEVFTATRFFRLTSATEPTMWVLDYAVEVARTRLGHRKMEVVIGQVVVDVDHSARHDLHTGIQQVVRQVVPRLAAHHAIVPVVWTDPVQAIRTLQGEERRRVLHWGVPGGVALDQSESPVLILPWRSVVLLPEVPFPDACERLAALAGLSGNSVVAIGYDCVPVMSADQVPMPEANRFGHYLSVVKFAKRVGCIGATATTEFNGFCQALPAQGLAGPTVIEIPLPVLAGTKMVTNGDGRLDRHARPLVLSVGTFEPRKNHLGLLYAAERLWREGRSFDLLLIGGSGWGDAVPREIARLQAKGRPVVAMREATDSTLRDAYRRARFTVFASLHEGFGLPAAESLEYGTPVITSNFGSTAEIAAGGGAIVIDPYDDEALVSAMRRLLADDEFVADLRRQIAARPVRSWDDYAADLWSGLVAPALSSVSNSSEDSDCE
jgi:glycosyltransferase involved in cell wall biosynthesis